MRFSDIVSLVRVESVKTVRLGFPVVEVGVRDSGVDCGEGTASIGGVVAVMAVAILKSTEVVWQP